MIEAPAVRVFDARKAGLDERGLRELVTAWSTDLEEPYVSKSYCYPHAAVAWHTEPVGVDLERVTGAGAELSNVSCSKEALAKALGDALDYDPRRLGSPMLWPDGEAGPWRALKLDAPTGHVGWVCWRAAVRGGVQLVSRAPGSRRATSSSSRSSSRPRVTASSSPAQ